MAAVKIGHASRDEYGKAAGGRAGDQDGKEVCIRDWYAGRWNVVLRPKYKDIAEKMARFCEAVCMNPNVGYDQGQRNTLRRLALMAGWDGGRIATPCETDCSAFMTVCAEAAGVDMAAAYAGGNAPTTWTMRRVFAATGAFEVLTESRYLVGDTFLRRGDVLLRESGHTAMVLSDGASAYPACNPEPETVESTFNGVWYTVKAGDTLWGISKEYGVPVNAICTENGISSSKFIYPGQKLKLPTKGALDR